MQRKIRFVEKRSRLARITIAAGRKRRNTRGFTSYQSFPSAVHDSVFPVESQPAFVANSLRGQHSDWLRGQHSDWLRGRHSDWMGLTLCHWLCDDPLESRNIPFSPSASPFRPLSVMPPVRLAVLLDMPPVAPGDLRSQWSPTHRSPNLCVGASGMSVCRPQVERSSDAAQSAVGVRTGLHVWELCWEEGQRGSHALVGVSTGKCSLQMSGYTALVGGDSCSWGWELSTNQLWHDGKELGVYPVGRTKQALNVPERVLVVVDADAGTVGYVVDGCFLGEAFRNLPSGAELFLAVSCVWGGATIHLRYLNGMKREAPSLLSLGRLTVRQFLGWDKGTQIQCLALPLSLEHLLLASD